MPRGGYRKPGNPAPVSGPGKLSRRTDGGPGSKQAMREVPSNGQYGYRAETTAATAGATVGPGYTPEPSIPNRFAMINKYADMLDTVAAQGDAPPEFKEFWNYVKTEARNTQ